MALTYGGYLRLEQLLGAQQPLSHGPEHDELLFIVIHQVYELWFKQVLHETHKLHESLERMLTICKTLVAQVDVLETMTPMSLNSFRARLGALHASTGERARTAHGTFTSSLAGSRCARTTTRLG